MSIQRRVHDLENARPAGDYGLPRTPEETNELLARVRAEKLRRIRLEPAAYGQAVARTLAKLEPGQRAEAMRSILADPMTAPL